MLSTGCASTAVQVCHLDPHHQPARILLSPLNAKETRAQRGGVIFLKPCSANVDASGLLLRKKRKGSVLHFWLPIIEIHLLLCPLSSLIQ